MTETERGGHGIARVRWVVTKRQQNASLVRRNRVLLVAELLIARLSPSGLALEIVLVRRAGS